jgi:hypothetical protein
MDMLVKGTRRHRRWLGVTLFACLAAGVLWLERRDSVPPSPAHAAAAGADDVIQPLFSLPVSLAEPLVFQPVGGLPSWPDGSEADTSLHETVKDAADTVAPQPPASGQHR